MQRSHPVAFIALIVSGMFVIGGAVLLLVSNQAPASFGWFAYQPMTNSLFMPGSLVVLTPSALMGAAVAVLGLLGLTAVSGYLLGRRARGEDS